MAEILLLLISVMLLLLFFFFFFVITYQQCFNNERCSYFYPHNENNWQRWRNRDIPYTVVIHKRRTNCFTRYKKLHIKRARRYVKVQFPFFHTFSFDSG